jgi:hypothetical protein
MEKVVPPQTRSTSRSPFLPAADINKPLPPRTRSSSRSPFSPQPDKDKPLPERPRRSSSVYTADTKYTRTTDNYSSQNQDDEPPQPLLIQPIAYQETISALLRRRLEDPPSPKAVPAAMSIDTLASPNSQYSQQASADSSAVSAISAPSAADCRSAPSFKEFSRNLQKKRINVVKAVSPLSPPWKASPDFQAVSYESTRRIPSISPRTSDLDDQTLVPAPLSVSRGRSILIESGSRPNANNLGLPVEEERSQSRFSSSSSEDSYVIYTGIRDAVRAYVRHKMQKRRESPKKERERVMSIASAKYPGMLTAKDYDSRLPSVSRKDSIKQGFSSAYDKISKLSISGSSGQSKEESREEKKQPRGRQKQLAIPTSGYQKYGAAVWQAPKRQKKPKRSSAPTKTLTKKKMGGSAGRHPSMSTHPAEVVGAFKNGRRQIIHALDDTKHKMKRSDSEKRREVLKESIRLVGPADHVSDGNTNYSL